MLLRFFLLGPPHERLQRLSRLGRSHFPRFVIRVEHEARMDCRVPCVGRFEDPAIQHCGPRRRRREHVAATEFKAKVAPYLVGAAEL